MGRRPPVPHRVGSGRTRPTCSHDFSPRSSARLVSPSGRGGGVPGPSWPGCGLGDRKRNGREP
eukprot:13724601-Alexandrium_andersonii.AAC.1